MNKYTLKELMVPVDDYASISVDASMLEGILALEEAQRREFQGDPKRHRDRAVLVKDSQGQIIGKLSMWSIIGCLEPRYDRIKGGATSSMASSRVGSARVMIEEIMESSHLWRSCLSNIVDDTAHLKIQDLFHTPREYELIDESESLEVAIHRLVAGHFMSLLVTSDNKVVGILRLVDVFKVVCNMIRHDDVQATVDDGKSSAD